MIIHIQTQVQLTWTSWWTLSSHSMIWRESQSNPESNPGHCHDPDDHHHHPLTQGKGERESGADLPSARCQR